VVGGQSGQKVGKIPSQQQKGWRGRRAPVTPAKQELFSRTSTVKAGTGREKQDPTLKITKAKRVGGGDSSI
jgi:hypothetical protein